MTAKRFTHKMNQLGMQFICYDDKAELLGTFADADGVTNIVKLLNVLNEENEQLKQELKVYRKVASCSNCEYHNYDWDIDDGYGGEEYEVCDKGNDVTYGICEEWVEL